MRRLVNVLFLVQLVACTGTDVGNPPRGGIASFDTPGCKETSGVKGVDPPAAVWLPDQGSYSGLQCFLWDRQDDGKLRIRVTNYGDGCHSNEGWQPRAIRRGDREVDLLLESPECLSAACGWCIYDLLFVLDASLTTQPELSLNLLEDPECGGEHAKRDSVTLALDHAQGAVCGYANPNALSWWAMTHGRAGAERMPCPNGSPDSGGDCAAGLTCTPVDSGGKYPNHRLCLASCQSDADCSPSELMRCQQGTCQLAVQKGAR